MVIVNGYSANDSVLVYLIFMQRELRSRLSTHYRNQKDLKVFLISVVGANCSGINSL